MKEDQQETSAAASWRAEATAGGGVVGSSIVSNSLAGGDSEGSPLVLAIDTSTAVMAAALLEGDRVLGELNSMSERNHSVYSVPALQELLRQANKTPDELAAIAVGRGPGSYTGTRIAVTIGKTLAWAWGKPLVGVSSLEGIAYGAWRLSQTAAGEHSSDEGDTADHTLSLEPQEQPKGSRWFVPMIDARRGQAYTALFRTSGGHWERLANDSIRLTATGVEELAQQVREADEATRPEAIVVAGEQLELHSAQLGQLGHLLEGTGTSLHTIHYAMEGAQIARLGRNLLLRGEVSAPHALVPNYTQMAEAEAKLAAARGQEVPPRG